MASANDKTMVVRKGLEQACKDFTARVEPLGFLRTKKMFWTRRHPLTVDFIHFDRCGSSYGAPLNFSVDRHMEFGIRVLNDSFVAPAINGPYIDANIIREGRYHLRFNAKTGSTYERCIEDLVRLVIERAEPWFQRFQDVGQHLNSADSPLKADLKLLLASAYEGKGTQENITASLKMLGIK